MVQGLRIAWYRYRATFARQLTGYLTVVLLIGLIGGIGMAAVAAARRTQSSYPQFLASTNPSDLTMAVYGIGPSGGGSSSLKATIAGLPGIKGVVTTEVASMVVLGANGAARLNTLSNVNIAGSLDGMLLTQDRLAVVKGRAADQSKAIEIVMTTSAAKILGVHIGQIVPLGLFTQAQTHQPDFGTPRDVPLVKVRARLVGIADLNTEVVQDGVDQTFGTVLLDRALMRQLDKKAPGSISPALYGIQLDHVHPNIAKVERELIGVVPHGSTYEFHVTSSVTSQVELAIKPESVALGTFGAIAALISLVLAAQAISRLLRRGDEDRHIMRAFGASPLTAVIEGLVGILFAVVLGAVIAFAVATVLSPLGPLGPVRPI
jgi:hypothetical protein